MITQHHFTSWPDHGVPEYGTAITGLPSSHQKGIQANFQRDPLVISQLVNVHAVLHELLINTAPSYSAGVGRTGTLIAIDIMVKQVEKEGMVDVSRVITNVKHQRSGDGPNSCE